MSVLIIKSKKQKTEKETRVSLSRFPFRLGRDPSNELALEDEEVSRFHARIKQRGSLFIIEDLDSRNGTFVNGDRVVNSIIKNGDNILLGQTQITFHTNQAAFQIAQSLDGFNPVIAEDFGIAESINIKEDYESKAPFKPIRLEKIDIANQSHSSNPAIKQIFDLHSNILIAQDLEEAGHSILKSIHHMYRQISRGVLLLWNEPKSKLIPISAINFGEDKSFLLSQRSLNDVLFRKQGIYLGAQSKIATQSGRQRIVLPISHQDRLLCIIHAEIDDLRAPADLERIKSIENFLIRAAPSLDTMVLRAEIDEWIVGIIQTMVATIEAKDTYTHGHSERVSRYCAAIADELKLKRETKRLLVISALCHDIGKIGIPDAILKKASFLSAEEYEEMKLHPLIGSNIIQHVPNAQRFISGVKYHHEKWDGTGYPDGLVGEDIPFFARIVALADAYDAMISGRSYSGFMDQQETISRLEEEQELFDPEILKAFMRAAEKGRITPKTSTKNQKPRGSSEED